MKERSRDCIKFPNRAEARDFLPSSLIVAKARIRFRLPSLPPSLPASLQLGSNFSAERKRELREAALSSTCEQSSRISATASDQNSLLSATHFIVSGG